MLKYLSNLCFNLGEVISCVWDTSVFYVIQYCKDFVSSIFSSKVVDIYIHVNFMLLVIYEKVK